MNGRLPILIITFFFTTFSFAQKKLASVSGKVIDQNEIYLPGVSVTILGQQKGIITSDSGFFQMNVPADKAFALIFSTAVIKLHSKTFY